MVTRTANMVVVTLTMLLAFVSADSAQTDASNDEKLTARRLENVQIKAQRIGQMFSRLALSYDIPIGLEIATNENELAECSLELKESTLSDLLTKFVTEHKEYRWEIRDGTDQHLSQSRLS